MTFINSCIRLIWVKKRVMDCSLIYLYHTALCILCAEVWIGASCLQRWNTPSAVFAQAHTNYTDFSATGLRDTGQKANRPSVLTFPLLELLGAPSRPSAPTHPTWWDGVWQELAMMIYRVALRPINPSIIGSLFSLFSIGGVLILSLHVTDGPQACHSIPFSQRLNSIYLQGPVRC